MASGPLSRLISGTVEVGLQPSLAFASDAPQRLGHFIKACFTRGEALYTQQQERGRRLSPLGFGADSGTAGELGPAGWPWDLLVPVRGHIKGEYLNDFLEGPRVFTGELQRHAY